ncbi:MAG TPA: OmpA family protein [Terriglobia bacterium]|nr:OmpA family protein [Terriglobia bacterium]
MKAWNAVVLSLSLAARTLLAQGPAATSPVSTVPETDRPALTISVNVVERTAKAINYRHRGGATTIDFKGTQKMPAARGEAKVESKQGYIEIEVEFDNLRSATQFGPEYLTYVMWAITPEGRATNLGEVILNGTKSKLNVTTELQAFGLVVTAEPYFAVSQPSDVVVMENAVRWDTLGQVEQITTRYELLQQGQYTLDAPAGELKPLPVDKDTPLDLNQARNAVRIARWAGAHRDAAGSFEKAQKALQQAEAYKARKAGTKPISMMAREAAQTAEDARLIALKRQEDQRLADERQASANRESDAKAQADRARAQSEEDSRRRAQAELEQRLEAERRARAEAERTTALALAEIARERALRDQAAADQAREAAARAEAERKAALAMADAEKARALNERAAADQAREAAARAEREKLELRSSLIQQLNLILDTRETDRGLVINISDVLFDTGQYTLKPAAREKLARVSGIVLAHPGLRLEAEGHTDSIGTEEFNQQLSEKRALSVRDFLVEQGIPLTSLGAQGFGKAMPVAPNDTAAGRQRNRRVELIVAGDVIGIPFTARIAELTR